MKYKVLYPINVNGTVYEVGDTVKLTEEQFGKLGERYVKPIGTTRKNNTANKGAVDRQESESQKV